MGKDIATGFKIETDSVQIFKAKRKGQCGSVSIVFKAKGKPVISKSGISTLRKKMAEFIMESIYANLNHGLEYPCFEKNIALRYSFDIFSSQKISLGSKTRRLLNDILNDFGSSLGRIEQSGRKIFLDVLWNKDDSAEWDLEILEKLICAFFCGMGLDRPVLTLGSSQ